MAAFVLLAFFERCVRVSVAALALGLALLRPFAGNVGHIEHGVEGLFGCRLALGESGLAGPFLCVVALRCDVLFSSGFRFFAAFELGAAILVALARLLLAALLSFAHACSFAAALTFLACSALFKLGFALGDDAGVCVIKRLERIFGNLVLHDVDGLADELLDALQKIFGIGRDEGHGEPACARTSGTADAVHIIFRHEGKVVVHDIVHLGNVDAARQNVGGNDDVGGSFAEAIEGAAALSLRAVCVDGVRRNADATQATRAVVCAPFRLCEDDDARAALFLDKGIQELGLETAGGLDDILVDLVGRFTALGDFDDGGIVEDGEHRLILAAVDRRGEEQRLTGFGRCIHNAFYLRPKAHVEHAIRFVKDEDFDGVEVDGAALHEVDQAAGGGNGDIEAALELANLGVVGHAAHEGSDEVMRMLADGHARVADLAGELARWGDDEHEGAALAALTMRKLVHARKGECGGFARAGLGCGNDVAPLEDEGDGLLLNGGGVRITQRLDGVERFLGKSEFSKGSYDGLLRSCFMR